MSIDDRLDRLRTELDDEVSGRVRTPTYADIVGRHVRRRRSRLAAGGATVVIVAGGVLGGFLATVPGGRPSAVPPAGLTVTSPPASTQSGPFTSAPPPASSQPPVPVTGQTYPAAGASYAVVPDGSQFVWTDLKTGAHGHFGPTTGQTSSPSVSANGRRIAYKLNAENGIAVWDLDTRTALPVLPAISIENDVAISPDGTKVLWTEQGGVVRMATVGVPSSVQTVEGDGSPAAWAGDDAIVYLAYGVPQGGQCAVMRRELSAVHTSSCVLPTATLQSVFATNGSAWSANSISSSGDTSLFALGLTTGEPGDLMDSAVGVLSVGAEATPLHVLPTTVVKDTSTASVVNPVLIDNGGRLLFVAAGPYGNPGVGTVISLDVATGTKTTVMIGGTNGLGATSG